jgi:hypothetical protein
MPIDPARIIFAAKPKRENFFDDEDDRCKGCCFDKERTSVCYVAESEALKRGLPSCESGFVYQIVKIDVRQQDLFG